MMLYNFQWPDSEKKIWIFPSHNVESILSLKMRIRKTQFQF